MELQKRMRFKQNIYWQDHLPTLSLIDSTPPCCDSLKIVAGIALTTSKHCFWFHSEILVRDTMRIESLSPTLNTTKPDSSLLKVQLGRPDLYFLWMTVSPISLTIPILIVACDWSLIGNAERDYQTFVHYIFLTKYSRNSRKFIVLRYVWCCELILQRPTL